VFPWGMSVNDKTFPARFKRFLKFAKKQPISQSTVPELLFHLFGYDIEGELPIAAVEGLADHLPTQEGFWLHADPVILQPDLAGIYMLDNRAIQLDAKQIKELINEISPLFDATKEVIFTPHHRRWYLKTSTHPLITTTDPHLLVGKEVSGYMPHSGPHQQKWRRLMTEIQMALFQSNVNRQLKQAQKPEISSLWFWGSGPLPSKSTHVHLKTVWCDDLLAQGLAKLNNVTMVPFSVSSNNSLKGNASEEKDLYSTISEKDEAGDFLIVCDQYQYFNGGANQDLKLNKNQSLNQSQSQNQSQNQNLNQSHSHHENITPNSVILNSFSSLFSDLRKGVFDKLTCYWGDGYSYEVTRNDVTGWRYWIKRFL
jgi:hypothetical protein